MAIEYVIALSFIGGIVAGVALFVIMVYLLTYTGKPKNETMKVQEDVVVKLEKEDAV